MEILQQLPTPSLKFFQTFAKMRIDHKVLGTVILLNSTVLWSLSFHCLHQYWAINTITYLNLQSGKYSTLHWDKSIQRTNNNTTTTKQNLVKEPNNKTDWLPIVCNSAFSDLVNSIKGNAYCHNWQYFYNYAAKFWRSKDELHILVAWLVSKNMPLNVILCLQKRLQQFKFSFCFSFFLYCTYFSQKVKKRKAIKKLRFHVAI